MHCSDWVIYLLGVNIVHWLVSSVQENKLDINKQCTPSLDAIKQNLASLQSLYCLLSCKAIFINCNSL